MPAVAVSTEHYTEIWHYNHGWIVAPEGCWFQYSKTGRMMELHMDREPQFGDHFPYGTSWRATSIIAEQ